MKPYPEYKDSGVEWLGTIPAHWSVARLKRLGSIRYGLGEPPEYAADGVPLIRATNVSHGKITPEKLVYVNPEDIPSARIYWLRQGDIVVVRSGAFTGDSATIGNEFAGSIAGFDMVFRASVAVHYGFIQYSLLSPHVKNAQIDVVRTRAAQPHLNSEELGDCVIGVPPMSEQVKIVAMLDRETAEIDAFIADQEELIALLNERRSSQITQSVTRGLDSAAPLKPSGFEWIGVVPEHWSVAALRKVCTVLDCKHVTAEFVPDGAYPLASIRELEGKLVDVSSAKRTTEEFFHLLAAEGRRPRAGDLIMSRNATVGRVAIVPQIGPDFAMGQDVSLIRPQPGAQSSRYLQYALQAESGAAGVSLAMIGSTFKRINVADIKSLVVAFPPLEEQQIIVDYLDRETAEIDAAIADAREAIALSKERRAAVISAAVTGKIDVRDHAKAGRR